MQFWDFFHKIKYRAAGIAAGLLVGIGVGVLMQRISGRFMKTATEK